MLTATEAMDVPVSAQLRQNALEVGARLKVALDKINSDLADLQAERKRLEEIGETTLTEWSVSSTEAPEPD